MNNEYEVKLEKYDNMIVDEFSRVFRMPHTRRGRVRGTERDMYITRTVTQPIKGNKILGRCGRYVDEKLTQARNGNKNSCKG